MGMVELPDGSVAQRPIVNRNVLGFFREQHAVGAWAPHNRIHGNVAEADRVFWQVNEDGTESNVLLVRDVFGPGEWGGQGSIFRVNASGVMSTGWTSLVVEHPFHVGMETAGTPARLRGMGPVHNVGGHWYYFGDNGVMRTNAWQQTDGLWYRLGGNGQMLRNAWFPNPGTTVGPVYRLGGSGAMVTGWAHIGGATGHWYFFAENGRMQTGWVQSNGAWYWMVGELRRTYANGVFAERFGIEVDGVEIFPVGSMARNGIFNTGTVANPQWHAFDHAGVWLGQVGQPPANVASPWWSANAPGTPGS
jgi:glucan-binding YG repeat protein